MDPIVLNAHFDGEHICLDDDYPLSRSAKLYVTIVENGVPSDLDELYSLSESGLNAAYGDDEPEYTATNIIEHNPDYERR